MNTQPTISTTIFAGYDIKQTSPHGHLTQTNKKHIKAIFEAGMWSAKVNRINYEITKDGIDFSVMIWQNVTNDYGQVYPQKSFAKFQLVGYKETINQTETMNTQILPAVLETTVEELIDETKKELAYYENNGISKSEAIERLLTSYKECLFSYRNEPLIAIQYQIGIDYLVSLKPLQVNQVIQCEGYRLVVTAVKEVRKQSDIDLIYKNAPKGYSGIVDGQKYVMYNENGSTVYGPISKMPKNIFDEKLAIAKSKTQKGQKVSLQTELKNKEKLTKTNFKTFIKNAGDLFVLTLSSFDGMDDCVRYDKSPQLKPVKKEDAIGNKGVWLVGGRDYFTYYETETHFGIEVYNCCGSGVLLTAK